MIQMNRKFLTKAQKVQSKVQNKRTEEKPGHRKSDEKTKVVNLNK